MRKLDGIIYRVPTEINLDFQMGLNILSKKNGEYSTFDLIKKEINEEIGLFGLTEDDFDSDFSEALIIFDTFNNGWYKPFTEKSIFEENDIVREFIKQMAKLCIHKVDFKKLKLAYINKLAREGYIYSTLILIDNLKELERLACSSDIESIKKLPNFLIIEDENENFIGAVYETIRDEILFEKIFKQKPKKLLDELCKFNLSTYEEVEKNFIYNITCEDNEATCYFSYSDLIENGIFYTHSYYKDDCSLEINKLIKRLGADIEANEIAKLVMNDLIQKLNLNKKDFKNINNFFDYVEDNHIKQVPNAHLLFMPQKFKEKMCEDNIYSEVHFDNLLDYFKQSNPYGQREIFKEYLNIKYVNKHSKKRFQKILDNDFIDFYLTQEEQEEMQKCINLY
ncbi:hypothetical protein [Campylobacter sp. RM12651]|uniref:hypothetical protein n=1 Tax=Campylobacter sp. RM12651 TaxID=1660079 RepID=UPI001EFB18E8|nr:hypothetical protein [Campylobacter sp. RM12651]ULO04550.1 hypothetical protein AVBRAN_a0068 [Campylobacter sp. RM12651]